MPQLTLNLMGEFQVWLDSQLVQSFGTQKTRALLAYLAMEAGQAHSREHLACLFWPEQPEERARHSLRQALSALRSALADRDDREGFLNIERESVRFAQGSGMCVDAIALLDEVKAIGEHQHRRRSNCLSCLERSRKICQLYQGDFLAGFNLGDAEGFTEWAALRREWLHAQTIEALGQVAAYHENRAEWASALGFCQRMVQMAPWNEESHQRLMRLLAASGQRSAALRQFEICRKTLERELGIEPAPATLQLYDEIRRRPGVLSAEPANLRLPASQTPCFGRSAELAELAELLSGSSTRLVSIVGPGGVGKTRLALAVASEQIGLYPDGVAWISLQEVPVEADRAIRRTLALLLADAALNLTQRQAIFESQDPWEQVLQVLNSRRMLLVLDNLEHLPAAAHLVAEILQAAPGVIVLATSRQRLALREEWVFDLRGLAYAKTPLTADWQDFPAVALFTISARRVLHTFTLDEELAEGILRICNLVEGLPLAIELAAAWASSRPVSEIADALQAHTGILTSSLHNLPERQRSVHNSFDVSWQLLNNLEQEALMNLSIFRGGFSVLTARTAAGADQALVESLAEKSLVRRTQTGRWDLHSLVGQLAAERLGESGRAQEAARRHAACFMDFLRQRGPALKGSGQAEALTDIENELANIHKAWFWVLANQGLEVLEGCLEPVFHFYNIRGKFEEGSVLMSAVIEACEARQTDSLILGCALACLGALALRVRQVSLAEASLERAAAIFEQTPDMANWLAFSLLFQANVLKRRKKFAEARQLGERSLSIFQTLKDDWGQSYVQYFLGLLDSNLGRIPEAQSLLTAGLKSARRAGDLRRQIAPLNVLGDTACHTGDYAQAVAYFEQAIVICKQLKDSFNLGMLTANLGTAYHCQRDFQKARRYYEESRNICAEIGDRNGEAMALANMGELACAQKDFQQASLWFAAAQEINQLDPDDWTSLILWNNLADAAIGTGDLSAARRHALAALEMAETQQVPNQVGLALYHLARAWQTSHPGVSEILLTAVSADDEMEQDLRDKAVGLLKSKQPAVTRSAAVGLAREILLQP